ncbi:hypothetical protein MA16_Dca009659 [Dendrobium catenatum]|uniref:Uncharacterized protein n=1 Tax=Dendrobium catenatum TaxID=906689 RepID=A0A2I0VSN1_9ASPA|nr:hypothetical protein MA16_Dca009659 [Dendrobium catenatum]
MRPTVEVYRRMVEGGVAGGKEGPRAGGWDKERDRMMGIDHESQTLPMTGGYFFSPSPWALILLSSSPQEEEEKDNQNKFHSKYSSLVPIQLE